MRAARCRGNQYRVEAMICSWRFDRPSALWIHPSGPSNPVDELFRGKELAVLAIEHVEESILRRLHDHLALCAADLQICEHQRLRSVVVPVIPRGYLVVPDQLPGAG